MKSIINIILIIFIILIFLKIFQDKIFYYINSTKVLSKVDNKYYIVRNVKHKQKSADTLAHINLRVEKLLNHLKTQKTHIENIQLLLERYDRNNLVENINLDNTTYIINKGSKLAVCLTTRDYKEDIYDINSLMFVIIHELSHIGSKSYGHNKEFKDFFTFLLNRSIHLGIYKYVDYSVNPQEYCGIEINSSPL